MGKVIFNICVSLDGFVESPIDGVDRLFRCYFNGDTEVPFSDDLTFRVSAASAALFRESWPTVGADITGRRNIDCTVPNRTCIVENCSVVSSLLAKAANPGLAPYRDAFQNRRHVYGINNHENFRSRIHADKTKSGGSASDTPIRNRRFWNICSLTR